MGEEGRSQMSIEDRGLACSLAGFRVLCPADEVATAALVRAMAEMRGPVFLRAGRMKTPIVYQPDQKFTVGKAIELTEGSDVAIIATGLMVAEAIRAQEALDADGVGGRVIDMHTIKP